MRSSFPYRLPETPEERRTLRESIFHPPDRRSLSTQSRQCSGRHMSRQIPSLYPEKTNSGNGSVSVHAAFGFHYNIPVPKSTPCPPGPHQEKYPSPDNCGALSKKGMSPAPLPPHEPLPSYFSLLFVLFPIFHCCLSFSSFIPCQSFSPWPGQILATPLFRPASATAFATASLTLSSNAAGRM